MSIKLESVLRSECVLTGMAFTSKEDALQAVAEAVKQCDVVDSVDVKTILNGLKQREEIGSTGFGNQIAIPHCRLPEVNDFVVGVISVPDGITFGAIDEGDVRLLAFIVGPERESNDHIALLSEISHAMMAPGAIEEMVQAETPDALKKSLLSHSRGSVDAKDPTSKNLFHVFVTDEGKFREILQVFAAMEATALSVVEARTASEYLAKIPLFAGFWGDREVGVCRTITALVEKDFTNEVVRRIEQIAGDLDKSGDVSIAVQNVFYSSGILWS
jgi:PTS system nitrogen regulatory IIA component